MGARTYLDTSVISYVTNRPSRDIWNCTHIANGVVLKIVNVVCQDNGYDPRMVSTPEELMTS
jgi:hypothetical protein